MDKDIMKDETIDNLLDMVGMRDKITSELKCQPKEKEAEIAEQHIEKPTRAEQHIEKLQCELIGAECRIEKLRCELKEKEAEITRHVKHREYYEQIIKNLTTFK